VSEPAAEGNPWWEGGLRFACTQCGNCCSGPPGAVWVDEAEERAIAGDLGVDAADFRERFTRRIGSRRSLVEVKDGDRHDCVFLVRDSDGKARCRVYRARPRQCRTWPFWPENLASPEAWDDIRRRVPCPGMESGPRHGPVEIRLALRGPEAAE
jgi:Fe-S-cluster containining protein